MVLDNFTTEANNYSWPHCDHWKDVPSPQHSGPTSTSWLHRGNLTDYNGYFSAPKTNSNQTLLVYRKHRYTSAQVKFWNKIYGMQSSIFIKNTILVNENNYCIPVINRPSNHSDASGHIEHMYALLLELKPKGLLQEC